ncbi:hypothetical protein F5148DRAFT_287613 [Russula earlei]|uniref:Uncharacterized protein n=1 Tax=Russula earlei TaxID=71964 RepID=A0ACC0UP58_9AGAM|nr:hypothetical protein F5148DRAFT_287613 [Russula earlei]
MSDSQYVDQKTATRSYRPALYQMSAGLMRAREPYRVRNALTGLAIGSFIVGVWLYSMSAVKQDNFDDVDEEARAMARAGVKIVEEERKDMGPGASTGAAAATATATATTMTTTTRARGILGSLDGKIPGLLDPKGKTVVWGAPGVDSIGC